MGAHGAPNDRVWRTLSHKGPLFSALPPTSSKSIGKQGCSSVAELNVPHDGKVAIKRMREMMARRVLPRREKKAFEDRFWQSWLDQYAAKCGAAFKRPSEADAARLAKEANEAEAALRHKNVGRLHGVTEGVAGYDTACVDGKDQPIANFRIEAPGVFAGRGIDHPFAGRVKRAIRSSNVTINIGAGAKVHAPSDGGKWAAVVHDQMASWLASWKDPATGKTKYMRLANRTREDTIKFDLASRVAGALPALRKRVTSELARHTAKSNTGSLENGCCLLLIDRFALRVGGDSDGRVFGATTLLQDHINLSNTRLRPHHVSLSFIGKDSVPCVAEGTVSSVLYAGLQVLCAKAKGDTGVFRNTDDRSLNAYIGKQLGPEVTAKSVRTARACETYEAFLLSIDAMLQLQPDQWRWITVERLAVASVAMLCNHRKGTLGADTPNPVNEQALLERALREVLRSGSTKTTVKAAVTAATHGLNMSTAPGNYLDPRMTRAFEGRHGLAPGTCSSVALRKKFAWADGTPSSFRFLRSASGLAKRERTRKPNIQKHSVI